MSNRRGGMDRCRSGQPLLPGARVSWTVQSAPTTDAGSYAAGNPCGHQPAGERAHRTVRSGDLLLSSRAVSRTVSSSARNGASSSAERRAKAQQPVDEWTAKDMSPSAQPRALRGERGQGQNRLARSRAIRSPSCGLAWMTACSSGSRSGLKTIQRDLSMDSVSRMSVTAAT